MKAVVFDRHGGPEVLQYTDIDVPRPGPNDVLIRVKASGANYNDIWARRGMPGQAVIFPHVSGSDAAGIVEEIGSEVSHVKPGDEVMVHPSQSCRICEACTRGEEFLCRRYRVWGFQTGPNDGGHAEYARVPGINVVPKPAHLTWEEAGSLSLVLLTAWRMLVSRAKVRAGDYVLVWGAAGGVGTIALQVCRLFNAIPIAVASSDEKLEQARALGAVHTINRSTQDVADVVRKLTDRRGVDIVFEHVGQATFPTSIRSMKWGGTLVICGATTGFDAAVDIRHLWNRQLSLVGSHMGSKAELLQALRFVETGDIRPVVSDVLPLRDVAEGQRLMEQSEAVGKVVYVPDNA